MLLLIESPRISIVCHAHDAELISRHPPLPRLAERERNQLRHVGADGNGRLADAKELVDEGEEDAQHDANGPGAHGGARGGGVVFVVDDGTDFGVGAVVSDERGLELHLEDEGLVVLRVGEDGFVGQEGLDTLDDGVWEVGVALVDAQDVCHQLQGFFFRCVSE